ncbi:MAG: hypothetical protein HY710_01335 [Candidatus Latescibacteria bacterium]|nr:hypothetical protein [Candidatus Latescibacterota bacterium]
MRTLSWKSSQPSTAGCPPGRVLEQALHACNSLTACWTSVSPCSLDVHILVTPVCSAGRAGQSPARPRAHTALTLTCHEGR